MTVAPRLPPQRLPADVRNERSLAAHRAWADAPHTFSPAPDREARAESRAMKEANDAWRGALRDQAEPVRRFSQSRAIGLDMESATIAANGFRFRVPYGTLLIVSDRPMHGELKLPGMASDFYRRQVDHHLQVGVRAMEMLREMPDDRLHSRKLRSFNEAPFQ